MIKFKDILSEAKLLKFTGAEGVKVQHKHMCFLVARKKYFQLKSKGKNVKYCEGQVNTSLEDGEYQIIVYGTK